MPRCDSHTGFRAGQPAGVHSPQSADWLTGCFNPGVTPRNQGFADGDASAPDMIGSGNPL